jgi:hypothetical protein
MKQSSDLPFKYNVKNSIECAERIKELNIKPTYKMLTLTNSMAQKTEGSSPHSQQPATGPCPEPVESDPHPPSQSP